ncbi:MAG: 2-amino-4-hydroxy-6-hydroxymethyldihydropteridine diphosphokinase [Candidatus Omnitrophica bacterium]|nr:2-amino-4-hydroxy-6-hydroxymethyldihydropteridine diphosphokinase [Candidatus Omnitrophota bacterium]
MYVYIAIGSNLGDRLENIKSAIAELKNVSGITVEKISSIIETAPAGGPPQGKYLNGVIKIKTEILPRALLNILQNIEHRLGRKRKIKNGPRTIDLDMLLYGDSSINEPGLSVPHPRMLEREFVMQPLLEIESGIMEEIGKIKVK